MHHYFEALTNNKGDALTGYYVRLVDTTTGLGGTLYADTSLTPIISVSGVADAAKVDSDGNIDFYVAVGTYHMDIYATDATTVVRRVSNIGMNIDMDTAATAVAAQAAASASAVSAAGSADDALSYLNSLTTLPTSGMSVVAASRAALALLATTAPAVLTEDGRIGTFKHYTSAAYATLTGRTLSTDVAADTAQGILVATATGAWVRQFSGYVMPDWFGIVRGSNSGANTATNDAAFTAMWAALAAIAPSTGGAKVLHAVDLGPGAIEISSTIIPPGTVKIVGRGMGMSSTSPNDCGTLIIPKACTAFRFDYNRSSLSDLVILGDYSTTEAEYHGVHFRQTFFGTNIRVQSVRGDAFFAEGITASGYLPDCSRLVGCEGRGSRNGIYFDGADANVIQVIGGTFHNNRRWGVWDSSSLGNAYVGVETSGNGTQAANDGVSIGASTVSYSSNRYGVIAGQEAAASTNAPSGTTADNAYWYYIGAGGVTTGYPAWTSGILCRAGGCVRTDDTGALTGFTDCYAETNQGKAQCVQGTTIRGGMLGSWVWFNTASGSAPSLTTSSTDGLFVAQPAMRVASGSVTVNFGATQGNAANYALRASHATFGSSPASIAFVSSQTNLRFAYNNVSTWFEATGPNTTDQFNTGSAVPYVMYVPRLALPSTIGGAIGTARQVCRAATSSATYAAASGGTTVDTQARASQAQLAADLADMKAKLQAANLMT